MFYQGIWFTQKWIISSKQMLIGITLSPVLNRKSDSTVKRSSFLLIKVCGYSHSQSVAYNGGISCCLQRKDIGKKEQPQENLPLENLPLVNLQ